MPLRDKSVLITGSSAGIGRETARMFAREEARVVVTFHRDEKEAMDTVEECKELGAPDVLAFQLDVMDSESIKNVVEQTVDAFGGIAVLVNNAGVAEWTPLADMSFDDIETQLRTNLEGLIKMTKVALPFISETIVNVGSGAGIEGYADLSVYCATKFGVRGFSQALAKEMPDLQIFTVNPGTTATRMTGFRGVPPEHVAQLILNAAKGIYAVPSGSDINVWEHV
jgi:3-oxoacyl-[acyl-carrier protein] reductase